jgi:hypothetical protein
MIYFFEPLKYDATARLKLMVAILATGVGIWLIGG